VSQSIWTVRRFGPSTLDQAAAVLETARAEGLAFEPAMRFLGYAMERIRQGYGYHWRIARVWLMGAARRSRHRYSRGRNRDNYLRAGRRLLEALAGRWGLAPGTPAEMVWDKLEDMRRLQTPPPTSVPARRRAAPGAGRPSRPTPICCR
jgi:hypothetical protein